MARPKSEPVQTATIRIGDHEYPLDELTLNELAELEDVTGRTIGDMNFESVKVIRHVAYLFVRRTDPTATPESVGAGITMGSFLGGDNPPE